MPKIEAPSKNAFLRPYRSASRPKKMRRQPYGPGCHNSIFVCNLPQPKALTEDNEYADTIHCKRSSVTAKSRAIVGKAIDADVVEVIYTTPSDLNRPIRNKDSHSISWTLSQSPLAVISRLTIPHPFRLLRYRALSLLCFHP